MSDRDLSALRRSLLPSAAWPRSVDAATSPAAPPTRADLSAASGLLAEQHYEWARLPPVHTVPWITKALLPAGEQRGWVR